MGAERLFSRCHPLRRAFRDTRCRECYQVAASRPDDPLPAQILSTIQRAGPVIPPRCPKCGSVWASDGDFARCPCCGATFHRTSLRVLPPPRTTADHIQTAEGLRSRRERAPRIPV